MTYSLKDTLIEYIKVSKIPTIYVEGNIVEYDVYKDHICKKARLSFDLEDITDVITSSAFYSVPYKNGMLVSVNDGTKQIRYQHHTWEQEQIFNV